LCEAARIADGPKSSLSLEKNKNRKNQKSRFPCSGKSEFVERSVRISRTALSCLLHLKGYGLARFANATTTAGQAGDDWEGALAAVARPSSQDQA
jgi:hypothetical protein